METDEKKVLSEIYSMVSHNTNRTNELISSINITLNTLSLGIQQVQKEMAEKKEECKSHIDRTRKIEDFIIRHEVENSAPPIPIQKIQKIEQVQEIQLAKKEAVVEHETSWRETTAYLITVILFLLTVASHFIK